MHGRSGLAQAAFLTADFLAASGTNAAPGCTEPLGQGEETSNP